MRMTSGSTKRRFARAAAVLATTALAVTLAACGGTSGDEADSSSDTTLDFGISFTVIGQNPALNSTGIGAIYASPSYAALTRLNPDGSVTGDLAEEWGYVGEGNTVFEVKLRDDAEFSNGEPVDAEAVKGSMEYWATSNGPTASYAKAFTQIDVIDEHTVRFTLERPDDSLAVTLSQRYNVGMIIAPEAAADPDLMATESYGAGPYMVDPDESVADDHYTLVRNPNYWAPEDYSYDQIVVRVITDPNAMLSALAAGQIDVAYGSASQAQAAVDQGFDISSAPATVYGVSFLDRRDGQPLSDPRVRQALNLGIDREAIAKALFGDFASAQYQWLLPGIVGHVDNLDSVNAYDPDEAKKLLAEAGYPDGLSLTILSTPQVNYDLVTQAVAGDLAKIGVDLTIDSVPTLAALLEKLPQQTVQLSTYGKGAKTPGRHGAEDWFLDLWNTFGVDQSEIQSLLTTAATAPDETAQKEAYEAVSQYISDNALLMPTIAIDQVFYSKGVDGVDVTALNPYPNPASWSPAQ